MSRIGLIGYGAIGRSIARALSNGGAAELSLVAVCTREEQRATARDDVSDNTLVTTSVEELLDASPDLVVEAAGHNVVVEYGCEVLRGGRDLYVLSSGILANEEVASRLRSAALMGDSQVVIPAGALAGFDGLLSLKQAGLRSVTYTSTKPPAAWRGTEAEKYCDLDEITDAREFLAGSAREIALKFPKNANLAASVAFASLGFDRTRVHLIADPSARNNVGRITAISDRARLDVTMESGGFGENPKSSEITADSVLAALRNRSKSIRFL
jgi:aspartate dehydrogenase